MSHPLRTAALVGLLAAGCASVAGLDDDYVLGTTTASTGGSGAATTTRTGEGADGAGASGGMGLGGSGAFAGSGGSGGTAGSGGSAGHAGSGGAGGAGGGGPCHPPGLLDAFDGASIDTTLWHTQGATQIISVHDGMLHFTPQAMANFDQWAGLVTTSRYDVRDCSVWIEVPSLFEGGSRGGGYFQLWHADGQIVIGVANATARFSIRDGGSSNQSTVPYDPVAQRWWRIRESSGTVYLETAADGLGWTVQNHGATPAYVNDVAVGLGVNPAQLEPSPGEAQFDNFDLAP